MIRNPEKLKKYYEERTCLICNGKYYVSKTKRHGRVPAGIRPRNCVTCSTKCSKKYSHMKWNIPKGI